MATSLRVERHSRVFPSCLTYVRMYIHCHRDVPVGPGQGASKPAKHRVDSADAATVLEDARALTQDDRHPREERFVTLGIDALGRLLVVCWASRGEEYRIISARRANRAETLRYDKEP